MAPRQRGEAEFHTRGLRPQLEAPDGEEEDRENIRRIGRHPQQVVVLGAAVLVGTPGDVVHEYHILRCCRLLPQNHGLPSLESLPPFSSSGVGRQNITQLLICRFS